MSLPDDCGECPRCGQPQFGSMRNSLCKDCEPPRDERGRFIKRPLPAWWLAEEAAPDLTNTTYTEDAGQ